MVDSPPTGTRRNDQRPATGGAEIAARALELATAGSDPSAGAAELLTMAGFRPLPLEDAHFVLVGRLHRRSDDFAATRALPLVSAALQNLASQHSTVPTPGRKRRPSFWRRSQLRRDADANPSVMGEGSRRSEF